MLILSYVHPQVHDFTRYISPTPFSITHPSLWSNAHYIDNADQASHGFHVASASPTLPQPTTHTQDSALYIRPSSHPFFLIVDARCNTMITPPHLRRHQHIPPSPPNPTLLFRQSHHIASATLLAASSFALRSASSSRFLISFAALVRILFAAASRAFSSEIKREAVSEADSLMGVCGRR